MNSSTSHVNAPKILSWQQTLETIQQTDPKGVPVPFSVVFVTANLATGEGGEIIHYDRAVWHVSGGRVRPDHGQKATQPAKNPNHAEHATLNIRGLDSEQIRKVHLHLILTINSFSVR